MLWELERLFFMMAMKKMDFLLIVFNMLWGLERLFFMMVMKKMDFLLFRTFYFGEGIEG